MSGFVDNRPFWHGIVNDQYSHHLENRDKVLLLVATDVLGKIS